MAAIDLVVTDLDGTLWYEHEEIHERTTGAWRELDRRGITVVVATGRRRGSTRDPLARLGFAPPAVLMNGALVEHLGDGTRFHRHHFTADDAAAVLAGFRAANLEPCVYVEHDAYEVFLAPEPSTHPEHVRGFGLHCETADLAEIVVSLPVFMFGILGQDRASLARLAPTVSTVGETHVSRDFYGGHGITVVPRGLSKWVGVRAYCKAAGLDPSGVLAIGDGLNDVELLTQAAIAVVPVDGQEEVVRLADHVIASPRDGGWAEIVDLV